MPAFLRLILAAVLIAVIAKFVERARRSDQQLPPPQWPSWSERHPNSDTSPSTRASSTDPASPPAAGDEASEADVEPSTTGPVWADPVDGDCPPGFPVKVKTASGIYHLEGMINWERTHADRCYVSAAAAEADGYRASKM